MLIITTLDTKDIIGTIARVLILASTGNEIAIYTPGIPGAIVVLGPQTGQVIEYPDAPKCPNCGSQAFASYGRGKWRCCGCMVQWRKDPKPRGGKRVGAGRKNQPRG